MPKYPIVISIPEPCDQSWDAMTPVNGGRHCDSCRHTVVDFTGMTDASVRAYFDANGFGGCGRFYEDQLQRPLLSPMKPYRPKALAGFAAAAVLAITLASGATAQVPCSKGRLHAQNDARQTGVGTDTLLEKISGQLINERGEFVVNAYVELRCGDLLIGQALSDFDGMYGIVPAMPLPAATRCQLRIKYDNRIDTTCEVAIAKVIPPVRIRTWSLVEIQRRTVVVGKIQRPGPIGSVRKPATPTR